MKKMNIFKYSVFTLLFSFCACSDFFDVNTNDSLDHNKYIDEESEIYAGYIGIITQVQEIGDKAIYLTDTRGELLEPTVNSPNELHRIYNYEENLEGNPYADPAGYYDVIIACNDYLYKLYDFKEKNPSAINMDHYEALVSCTLRVKAWIYLTIAKIYGEAIWFDDPMREKKDLSLFPVKNLDEVVTSCKQLLNNGFDGINGQISMSWKEWVDPNTPTAESEYRYWDAMTPEFFALYAELCLWSGDYQTAANLLLNAMNEKFGSTRNDATAWLRNDRIGGNYAKIWDDEIPMPQETVSTILYDYKKNQTNSLLKHFGSEFPNEYLLAPSLIGMERFSDPEFNPFGGATSDPRAGVTFRQNNQGKYVIQKFRPLNNPKRTAPYMDDVHIYIYRGAELYFMLAEAMNNLGRYAEASALINQGLNGSFPNGGVTWEGFTDAWTSKHPMGNRSYPCKGIRGVFKLGNREFTDDTKANDLAILDEMLLEFPCEGKIYPAMIRFARRHNDYNIIADRVTPKYSNPGTIRDKILSGGYFIKWNLK